MRNNKIILFLHFFKIKKIMNVFTLCCLMAFLNNNSSKYFWRQRLTVVVKITVMSQPFLPTTFVLLLSTFLSLLHHPSVGASPPVIDAHQSPRKAFIYQFGKKGFAVKLKNRSNLFWTSFHQPRLRFLVE